MSNYKAPGKNGGFVSLDLDGEWVRTTWKNKSDTYETVIAVPAKLVAQFAAEVLSLGEVMPGEKPSFRDTDEEET